MSKTHEQKALERSIKELEGMIERPDDYGIDEITVASLQTAIESIQQRLDRIAPHGSHTCRYCGGKGHHLEEHEPVATEAIELLQFLAGRMEYAGVNEAVAKSYAIDIRKCLEGIPNA